MHGKFICHKDFSLLKPIDVFHKEHEKKLLTKIDEKYGTRDNSIAGDVSYNGYPALRLPSGRICTDGSVMYYKIMDRNTGNMIWIHGKLLIGHHVAVINKKAVIYAMPEEVKDASRQVPFGYKRYEEKMKAGDVVVANDRLDTLDTLAKALRQYFRQRHTQKFRADLCHTRTTKKSQNYLLTISTK